MIRGGGLLVLSLFLTACVTPFNMYSKPSNLLFQKQDNTRNQVIHVFRDNKLCLNDDKSRQNCPVSFYIDDFKAGDFYINNKANFYLKPDAYVIKVKSCRTICETYELKLNVNNQLENRDFTISIDSDDKPFIVQGNTEKLS
ncbi:hypothetical protein IAE19_15340 [Acinetobacter sp. S40]|uniref:hypothetical protein n=1 Tax=unclassified Acinetobacter TaxID=196816 RepID=UPI00190E3FB6|nr:MULTISPECIES: hypothetical protein [unclassified Acinetobacter]MBJ9986805.1 hypothetical protein [Acinetobacter sp. S40]MBK0065126.1 hypothetical protein [Acinetobacter sp. S55]MBK0068337.1 hypothetical protein [Acinetobacter sp. S54]